MNSVKNGRGGGETMQFNFSNAKKTQHNSLAIKLFNIKGQYTVPKFPRLDFTVKISLQFDTQWNEKPVKTKGNNAFPLAFHNVVYSFDSMKYI